MLKFFSDVLMPVGSFEPWARLVPIPLPPKSKAIINVGFSLWVFSSLLGFDSRLASTGNPLRRGLTVAPLDTSNSCSEPGSVSANWRAWVYRRALDLTGSELASNFGQ